jgi:type VII secretion protein EccB
MPSRQDQLHSYQFSMQRVVAALVMRETDPAQSPFRRAAGATLASILIAAIIAAGFGLYGVFTGRGSEGWRKPFAVVIEEETGASFVFQDNKLRPALNFTSAVLAGGSGRPSVHNVGRASLVGVPRGVKFGVPGLPDSLPGAGDLLGLPWSVCGVAGGATAPPLVLGIGDTALAGGGRELPSSEAVVVKAVGRENQHLETYLLWNGRLYPISENDAGLLYQNLAATSVPAGFANVLPHGERIAPVFVPNAGHRSSALPEYENGRVVGRRAFGSTEVEAYAVVFDGGLMKLTPLQARLVVGAYRMQNPSALDLDLPKFDGLPVAGDLTPKALGENAAPGKIPPLASTVNSDLCVVKAEEGKPIAVRAVPRISLAGRDRSPTGADAAQVVADYVFIQPGKGALISTGTATILLTDQGVGYALARPDVSTMLGFDGKNPVKVPSALGALIPVGPALDPDKVRESAPSS